jgi:uncharacterized membrane-anchored protein
MVASLNPDVRIEVITRIIEGRLAMSNSETVSDHQKADPPAPNQVQVDSQAGACAPNSVPAAFAVPKPMHPYKTQRRIFIAALVTQIGLLSVMAIQPALTIAHGTTVTFTTASVDPWDMFRGDYITLAYDFSSAVPVSRDFARDETMYVVLEKSGNGKWIPVRSSSSRPAITNAEIVLKGKVGWCDEAADGTKTASVQYGIERVYVPEGAGRNVRSSDRLEVDVAVGTDGSAVIKQLRSKEKTLYRFHLI